MLERALRIFGIRARLLTRGESVIAWIGLGLGALMIAGLASVTWWTVQASNRERASDYERQAEADADLLALSLEPFVEAGETSALRRFVVQATEQETGFEQLIVLKEDGSALAHSIPSQIGNVIEPQIGSIHRKFTSNSGSLELIVIPAEVPSGTAMGEIVTGIGVIGAAGFIGLLLVYRQLRKRIGALGSVREALIDAAEGETSIEALIVRENLGPVAVAWNALLRDRERLLQREVYDRAQEDSTRLGQMQGGIIQSACDAYWHGWLLIDESSRILYANGAAGILLRSSRDEIVGANASDILPSGKVLDTLQDSMSGRSRQRQSIEIESDDDAKGVLRFSFRPVQRDEAGAVLLVIQDVTQLRIAEQSHNQFVSQATHELRTPLTNIRLYVEEAIDLGEDEHAERSRCLNVINSETRRLERVVSDMLSVSEIESGAMSLQIGDVRLDQLFEDLRDDYQSAAAAKNLDLKFDLPPKLSVIRADREKLLVAIHNLLGNAVKYTPESGTVSVEVHSDEQRFEFRVRDTGIGIGTDDLERVFQRFYRAGDDRVRKITGTGIGLALAREIARLHGGDITVESTLNEGSVFTLTVPVAGSMSKAA